MRAFWSDVRLAVRSLLRRPGFTAIAVLTVGLGIGASTAVFTLVDGVLLRPLPLPDADELVSIQALGRDGQDELPQSPGLHLLYRDRASTLASVAMFRTTTANLVREGEPERLPGQMVTPSFFGTLGVAAARGRAFGEDEGLPGAAPVVVLSDGLWRTSFGADPGVIGTTVDFDGVSREIVGVMPPRFGYPDRAARFWLPLVIDEAQAPVAMFSAQGVGRMADGRTLADVQAELTALLGRLPEFLPGDGGAQFLMDVQIRPRTLSLKDALVGDVSRTLWILLGTVAFVLLITCANVANLLLVRAEGRQRELALRVAVGAGRWQVLRGFAAEGAVLAVLGGVSGLGIAALALRVTAAFIPADLPRMDEVGMDLRVLAFTMVLGAVAALFFTAFPLLRFGADDLAGQLRDGGGARGATGGRSAHRLRNALVVTQVALALVLLVGSGLMLRSFMALRAVDPGFDTEGVLTARVAVPGGEIESWQETQLFFDQVRQRLADLPGVLAVGWGSGIPLVSGGMSFGGIEVEDHPRGPDELPIFATLPQVDAGYFEALGIPVVEGRALERADLPLDGRGVVVNRSFAEEWWPDSSPLGRGVRYGRQDEEWYRIVGVVDDVRQNGLDQPVPSMIYFPSVTSAGEQFQVVRGRDLVVRVQGDPMAFVGVIRQEIRGINPRIPLMNPRSMSDVFNASTARTSFTMGMLGAASGIALLLGLVGIYGVVSYVVSQRTREIGVRMALGATAPSVRGMVVRQGLALVGVGIVVGLAAATVMSGVMESVLFGVGALDPLTYVAVSTSLLVVAVAASWLPAVRAAGVDPSRALRAD